MIVMTAFITGKPARALMLASVFTRTGTIPPAITVKARIRRYRFLHWTAFGHRPSYWTTNVRCAACVKLAEPEVKFPVTVRL
jgi:hypothetical protein